MGKRKDRAVIFEAANLWNDELVNEIIPGANSKEDREGFWDQQQLLAGALAREESREEARLEAKRRLNKPTT